MLLLCFLYLFRLFLNLDSNNRLDLLLFDIDDLFIFFFVDYLVIFLDSRQINLKVLIIIAFFFTNLHITHKFLNLFIFSSLLVQVEVIEEHLRLLLHLIFALDFIESLIDDL